MLRSITSLQLSEWMEFYKQEPFGEFRADLRTAMLMSLLANIHRDPDSSKEYSPMDFMPRFDTDSADQKQPVDKMVEIARAMASAGFGVLING